MRKHCLFIFALLALGCQKEAFKDQTEDPVYNFDCFWHEVDRHYPFFAYTRINWDSVYQVYRPQISANTPSKTLFETYSRMLDLLHDAHTYITTPYGIGGNVRYFESSPINQIELHDTLFETYTSSKVFDYGKLKRHNIGYIKLKTFGADKSEYGAIDNILNQFAQTAGLIIDVRSNMGGNLNNVTTVSSRFADTVRVVAWQRVRNGSGHNDFSDWRAITIGPNKPENSYKKPVAVLTNHRSFSATEWFVLSCKAYPNVTIIGDITGGGSSPVLYRDLPNSWILQISNSQIKTIDGTDFQFTGIPPDIAVSITSADEAKHIDTILERAIQEILNP